MLSPMDWIIPQVTKCFPVLTGSFQYWGGLKDLEAELRKRTGGHPIFTAAVGPFRQALEFWMFC